MPQSNIYSSLSAALPSELKFRANLDKGSDPDASYLDITITDNPAQENVLEGMTFDGYCMDTDRPLIPGAEYTAKVYSSYEPLPDELIGPGLIEKPENLDLINWIFNQGFEGQASTGNGTYSSGDVQRAIWSLIDDEQATAGLGPWNQARVDEILALAQSNGEGFVPEYDYTNIFGQQVVGKMGVILVPDTNNDGLPDKQIVITEVELSKIGDTVWSDCDADGIQDANEAGMAGVTVNLLADIDGDGVIEDSEVVDTTTTDANGNYDFTAIAGDYKVQFEQPENKLISPANQGGDDTVDSDGLISDVVTLAPGENDTTVDAGFYQPPSFKAALPKMLTFSVQLDAGSDPDASYLDITIKDIPGTENVFEGMTFDGYCIDTDQPINQNVEYTAKVYSSGEPLPDELIGTGLIEKPENFDQVNWILNQGFAGQASTGNGTYTSGDVQRAIWSLIDDEQATAGLGSWNQARVDEILSLAQSNGEGFVPEYDYTTIFGENVIGKLGVILVPDTDGDCLPDKQMVIAEVELSKIGDKVWSDCDADGIQDANEAGMAGVTVNLLADIDGDGVYEDSEIVETTTTDANGNYEFSVLAGDYKVQFEQPENKLISPANQGGDDTVDSDGLISDVVSVAPGENNTTVDAGFYHPPSFKVDLPQMLTFSVQLDAGSDPDASYLDISIKDIPGTENVFEGMTFDGYCIDTDQPINQNVEYTAKVYSSGEPLPDELIGPGLIEKPENFDLINWILNQGFEGKDSEGNGAFTSGDVQRAVWSLIDDEQSTSGLGSWNQARVDKIIALAQSNGEGFVAEYDYTTIFGENVIGKLGVILVPDTNGDCLPDKQMVIAEVELSKIGDTVGLDSNTNGIQDAGEAGMASMTVNSFAAINSDSVIEQSKVDTLTGTSREQTLVGYAGESLLTGGDSGDIFAFTSLNDGFHKITGFDVGLDLIDVSQVLETIGYVGNDPIADGYVQFGSSGKHTVISIDQDGLGNNYDPVDLVKLTHTNSLSASDFIF